MVGDKFILDAALLLFYVGIVQCMLKPWDLKKVSISSLVGSSHSEEHGEINSLHPYIEAVARYFQVVRALETTMQQLEANIGSVFVAPPCSDEHAEITSHHVSEENGDGMMLDANEYDEAVRQVQKYSSAFFKPEIWEPYNLFVDHTPPYSDRFTSLIYFLRNPSKAHLLVQRGLSLTFDRLYTKKSLQLPGSTADPFKFGAGPEVFARFFTFEVLIYLVRLAAGGNLFLCLLRFYQSNKEAYNQIDVKITYALICPLAFIDFISPLALPFIRAIKRLDGSRPWPDKIAQYNLIGYFARNRKHWVLWKVATLLVFKDLLDQLWSMKSCKSSQDITELVSDHIRAGWQEIHGITSYRRFNDNRGQWTLDREGLLDKLGWSLRRPFDESLLLWHLATDFCFHDMDTLPTHQAALRSRVMSNYMAYLLYFNPEMLIAGARRSLFRDTYHKVKGISMDKGLLGEREVTRNIIRWVTDTEGSDVIHDAWAIAKELINVHVEDEDKVWRVVQGVWVEMLCFSASRCRGYLHAKSMGSGGQYLSYVWLLLLYMGMETLAEKVQREDLQEGSDNGGTAAASRSTSPAPTAYPTSTSPAQATDPRSSIIATRQTLTSTASETGHNMWCL